MDPLLVCWIRDRIKTRKRHYFKGAWLGTINIAQKLKANEKRLKLGSPRGKTVRVQFDRQLSCSVYGDERVLLVWSSDGSSRVSIGRGF